MAKKTIIVAVDDFDGTKLGSDATQVKYHVGGKEYECDLSAKNKAKFDADVKKCDEIMSKWVSVSRRIARNGKPYRKTDLDKQNTTLVRKWANENGFSVSDRGRIPADVQDAYDAAH